MIDLPYTTYNEFEVGDEVTVVHKPYHDCPFSWVYGMNSFCDGTFKIVHKEWYGGFNAYGYQLEGIREFLWCGNCFVPKEFPEFDAAENSELMTLLGVL